MDTKHSNNPRSVRARKALRDALQKLLKTKPYEKISVTQIVTQAGLARHTFYNHYETKDDLLHALIDAVFLDHLANIQFEESFTGAIPERSLIEGLSFFEIWQQNAELVKILSSIDIEHLLVSRFKTHLMRLYKESNIQNVTHAQPELSEYMICIHTHAFVGVLMKWLRDGMKHPPEVMSAFLEHFIGLERKFGAAEKFRDLIV